jgi:hypothetical protein
MNADEKQENAARLRLATIVRMIDHFDEECEDAGETDTGEVWELLSDIRATSKAVLGWTRSGPTPKPEPLPDGAKKSFGTLKEAFANGDVALLSCVERATGDNVQVICAVNRPDGDYEFVPFARLSKGSPYDEWSSPIEEGQEA